MEMIYTLNDPKKSPYNEITSGKLKKSTYHITAKEIAIYMYVHVPCHIKDCGN
jgi:hypothetical protein